MTHDLGRVFADVHQRLDDGQRLLLLTDFDGTLAPISSDPTGVELAPEVRRDLHTLASSAQITVGVVSGRRLDDVRGRVRLPGLYYAGCHGLEIEGPGLSFRHSGADAHREHLLTLAHALGRETASMPGVLVEHKGLAVAVHHRNAEAPVAADLEALLARLLAPHDGDLCLLRGKKVIEVLPTPSWNKGHAVLRLCEHVRPRGASPLAVAYLGDDAGDELAFCRLDGTAITVKVGPGRTSARYRLPGVDDVHRLLAALAAEVRWQVGA